MSIQAFTFEGSGDDFYREEITFKSLFFPGGEPHVEILGPSSVAGKAVLIDARIGTWNEFGTLLALTDAIKQGGPLFVELFLPYFPGARQDRREPGFALTAKLYADLINAQEYHLVTIVDPHSPVTPALLDNCVVRNHFLQVLDFVRGKDVRGLIAPDAGAEKKTLDLARFLGIDNVVFARKKRNPKDGKLSGFQIDKLPEGRDGFINYLVADDICDGGRTFIGLADEFHKDPESAGFLHLFVTHGIFSQGFEELLKVYDSIGYTDSFPGPLPTHPRVSMYPLLKE